MRKVLPGKALDRLLRSVKRGVFSAGQRSGLLSKMRDSRWRRRRVLFLCYHGVSQKDEHNWSDLYVSPKHLARRFELIEKQGYQVLSLPEALRGLGEGGRLPPRSVVLTFDDGTADFYSEALPLLKDFGFAATVYLTTYYCFYQRPVFDPCLSYILWCGRGRRASLPNPCPSRRIRVPKMPSRRKHLVAKIREEVTQEGLSADEKDQFLQTVAERLSVDYGEILNNRLLHLMSKAELQSLPGRTVDLQLHTHRHRMPGTFEEFRRELSENKRAISTLTGREVDPRHFCYPSGQYSLDAVQWVRELGLRSAVTCDPGLAGPGANDNFLLPRFIDTMGISEEMFLGWLSGFASWLPRRRRRAA